MLIASMTIFGTLGPFVRNIPVSSGELALYRAVLAALLIALFLLITKQKIPFSLIKKEVPKIPLYKQTDYPNVPYGSYGSIASHGCGITCLAMVATYLSDEIYTPPQLAKQFGHYNTDRGSMWILFEDSAKKLDIDLQERTSDTKKVVKALKNGQIVIALQSTGLFTGSGHFIVLTGIKDNGRITVNDPNAGNYQKNSTLINGFKNGFSQSEVFANGGPYWIYEKKGT